MSLVDPGTNGGEPGLQLEEVLYSPAEGAPAFIELGNAGGKPVDLRFLTLRVDNHAIPLRHFGDVVAPGARLLIAFDGPSRTEGSTHHAGESISVSSDAGHAAILDRFGATIDEVAWGEAPGAVNPVSGGVRDEIEPGSSIGRVPGVTGVRDPLAWINYPPAEVTAGAANPPVTVRKLHPLSGVRTQREGARLSWFPVPGAGSYQVQVAADEKFTAPLIDQITERSRIDISTLQPGRYVWRVRPASSTGKSVAWSGSSVVSLVDGSIFETAAVPETEQGFVASIRRLAARLFLPVRAVAQASPLPMCPPAASQPGQETCRILAVPFIRQHKDTEMLLLERNVAAGPHAWDNNHGDLDERDPADNANCTLASLAMMNWFAGGNLSQDRIGFEFLQTWMRGPEQDLMYGQGSSRGGQLPIAYRFALGTASIEPPRNGVNDLWTNVTNQLRNGNPVLSGPPGHNLVIIGFRMVNGHRLLVVNDPWETASQEYDIDDPVVRGEVVTWFHWLPAGDIVARHQEPTVTQDSDGDRVVDFDETNRFATDPDDNDSDSDGVGDKQDIYASVFDRRFGYGRFRTGRDEDRDGKAMELDPDSDAGGCNDGREDRNANGIHDRRTPANVETWNFDFIDDSCQDLVGHLTYRVHSSVTIVPDVQWGDIASTTSISVRLKPVDGQPGYYEDDGSRFQYQGSAHSLTVTPGCEMIGQSWASASGDFLGDDAAPATGQINDDGRLAVHFTAGIPSASIQGYASICGSGMFGSGGDSHSAEFRDECGGDAVTPGERGYVPGKKTFRFSCHEQHWSASGIVSVP